MANHVLLETVELTQSTETITFDNIPQSGYTDLKFVMSLRATTSSGNDSFDLLVNFNGSSANKSTVSLRGDGSGVNTNAIGDRLLRLVNPSDWTANTFSNVEMYVPNYTTSGNKTFLVNSVLENNATTSALILFGGLWSSSAAITSMSFTPNGSGAKFSANSTISLYGVSASGVTPSSGPKAAGGNVATDGTYWYHTFLSSGLFTPSMSLSCDILQIAGGGSGGYNVGGGGGAGGLLAFTSQSLTTQNYPVVVGAGSSDTIVGVFAGITGNGSNSQFGSLTASVGGGGGGSGSGDGLGKAGGSGGGGSYSTGGAASPAGQGYAGGTGQGSTYYSPGGGGGAGAVGANSNNNAGAGGAGVNTYSSWASATGTGSSGYYAGGGGGGGYAGTNGGLGAAGGAGGGGTGSNYNVGNGTNGLANTGGGGGGGCGGSNAAGYKGGSGIVIIRYAV